MKSTQEAKDSVIIWTSVERVNAGYSKLESWGRSQLGRLLEALDKETGRDQVESSLQQVPERPNGLQLQFQVRIELRSMENSIQALLRTRDLEGSGRPYQLKQLRSPGSIPGALG